MPLDNSLPCRTQDGLVAISRNANGVFVPCNGARCYRHECAFVQMTYMRLQLNQNRHVPTVAP
jgi:hypothetical protein